MYLREKLMYFGMFEFVFKYSINFFLSVLVLGNFVIYMDKTSIRFNVFRLEYLFKKQINFL